MSYIYVEVFLSRLYAMGRENDATHKDQLNCVIRYRYFIILKTRRNNQRNKKPWKLFCKKIFYRIKASKVQEPTLPDLSVPSPSSSTPSLADLSSGSNPPRLHTPNGSRTYRCPWCKPPGGCKSAQSHCRHTRSSKTHTSVCLSYARVLINARKPCAYVRSSMHGRDAFFSQPTSTYFGSLRSVLFSSCQPHLPIWRECCTRNSCGCRDWTREGRQSARLLCIGRCSHTDNPRHRSTREQTWSRWRNPGSIHTPCQRTLKRRDQCLAWLGACAEGIINKKDIYYTIHTRWLLFVPQLTRINKKISLPSVNEWVKVISVLLVLLLAVRSTSSEKPR